MPSRGASGIAVYMAWNTSTNQYQTGDVANHTIRFLKDGVEAAPTNSPSEVDSTNAPGAYAISWTSTEGTVNILWIGGKSATANVVLIPMTIGFALLPTAAPGASNGLITIGSSAGQLTVTSGFAFANLQQWEGLPPLALTAGGLVQASAAATVSGTVNANIIQVLGTAVTGNSGFLQTNPVQVNGIAPTIEADGRLTVAVVSGLSNANVTQWQGTAPNALQNGLVQAAVLSGAATSVLTTVNANVTQAGGTAVVATSGFLQVNTVQVGGIAPTIEADGRLTVAVVSGLANANVTQWLGAAPNVLQNGLVQVAQLSGATTSVIGSVGSVTARVTANTDQWAGVTVNALISGRVDSIANQVGTSTIATGTFTPAALTTSVFASQFLTAALIDSTYGNSLADSLLDRANAIETGLTPRQSWRLGAAADGGQLSGAGTTNIGIWGAGVSTTRVSAVTSQSGNRSSVTLNL